VEIIESVVFTLGKSIVVCLSRVVCFSCILRYAPASQVCSRRAAGWSGARIVARINAATAHIYVRTSEPRTWTAPWPCRRTFLAPVWTSCTLSASGKLTLAAAHGRAAPAERVRFSLTACRASCPRIHACCRCASTLWMNASAWWSAGCLRRDLRAAALKHRSTKMP
jgi:hypothetical protein